LAPLVPSSPSIFSAVFSITLRQREVSSGWASYPNLRLRPHAPHAGRGRLQRQIRRAFTVHGPELSATTIYDWCALWPVDKRASPAQRWSVRRILDVVAERTGRATTIGRPWIWRLKQPAADTLSAPSG
jgi:hypothetical protein